MSYHQTYNAKSGFTLIELLIAIAVTSILVGVVFLMLQTAFDVYHVVQDDMFLQKAVDETLQIIVDGDFQHYGIKDSLEILEATSRSISFVPLWADDSKRVKGNSSEQPETFILNRPFKPGASLPIVEVLEHEGNREKWRQVDFEFQLGADPAPGEIDDKVLFDSTKFAGSKLRVIYHPDEGSFPDVVMRIWNEGGRFMREYKGTAIDILRYPVPHVTYPQVLFQYFDNTNMEILPDAVSGRLSKDQIPNVTAVKVSLEAQFNGIKKFGSTFINIRNTRAIGSGLLLRNGSRLKIPNSAEVRALSLMNLAGAKKGGVIQLEAVSDTGRSWRINLMLNQKDGQAIIEKYSIEYPSGNPVFTKTISLTTDLPLNFMTLGADGRYDYDLDKDTQNVVNLDGQVELKVLRMDAAGASLFVRP